MHVLIHEPNHRGHRFTTVRVLINALLNLNRDNNVLERITLATTKNAVDSDEFREQIAPYADKLIIFTLPETKISRWSFFNTHRQILGLRHCLKTHQYENGIDHLYLPYADFQLQLITLYKYLPGCNWWPPTPVTEAQIMLSGFAYPFAKKSRQLLTLLAVKKSGCERIHLNDMLATEYLNREHPGSFSHVASIPDPITQTKNISKSTAREFLNLPSSCRIIGSLGVINERKGADVLIKAFKKASLEKSDILLLAGRLSPSIKTLVKAADDERIVCLDRYLTENELSHAISAMDLVVTPYQQVVGSASIIIRTAVSNRMVLSADTGWSGTVVPRFGLGTTCSVSDVALFTQAIERAIELAPEFELQQRGIDFVRYNSEKNVQAHWVALLKQRLNIQSSDSSLVPVQVLYDENDNNAIDS